MMLKTKRIFNMDSKSTSATCQKIWPFLAYQRKDKRKETKIHLAELHPVDLSIRSFLRTSLLNKHISSIDSNDPESFHCAIAPILLLAQLFGVLPVSGIRKPSPFRLKFIKFSFRTAYTVSTIMMVLVMATLSVIHMIKTLDSTIFAQGGLGATTAGAIFYGNSMMVLIIFLWLSPHWVTLQRDWRAMEQFIDSNKMDRPKLRWKFYTIAATILILAIIEHMLSIAINSEKHDWSGKTENSTFSNFLKVYCVSSHAFILDTLKYNFVLGIFIFIISKLATFIWNFTDVFIMLVSTGLAERYKILNKQVIISVLKRQTMIDWNEFREDYAVLASMVKKVDRNIASIILLSFANNLYFICLQLLNGLFQPNGTIISDVYFFGSFLFLIGRTMTVTLLTARINDRSKEILPTLYTCSASSYNIETERLIYQLTTDDVALTGMRFFSITRNFMLAVVGTILTYEVILLQFSISMHN